ncbi:metallophosphoesterase family protein [Crassaminicella profunda]|uniref:metallophosphoesterase family protein n=1 Tax=Crassaminicella profunda TaxID=1286698 RepID=UPI001CA6CAE1|nr:metallophosphoesterase family protein [Crassaminicella profunda]QZY55068.1 metallophosphatase family protein [Crassaminicella profunda]
MKIGIISDTHIGKNMNKLIHFLDEHLKEVDMIIHAGDYKTSEAIKLLQKYKPFLGVWGNVDCNNVKKLLHEKEIIKVNNYHIGIYHGHGTNKTTIMRAYEAFQGFDVDIIVFGHSHQPIIQTKNKVLLLNPGSPIYKRKERWFSYIILQLEENNIDVQLKFWN